MNSSNTTVQVLENLVLFAVASRVIGTEREAGETEKRGDSRKLKVLQSVINPLHLAGFKQVKTECFRLCRSYGSRIDVLGAWGVPKEDAEALTDRLKIMQIRWNELTKNLVIHWQEYVTDWANKNPEYSREIYELAPKADEVAKKTKFVFAPYTLSPEQIQGNLDDEFNTLPEQAAKEIMTQIYDCYTDLGKTGWDFKSFKAQSARTLLQNIARKAGGLGFLHSSLAGIPAVVEALLAQLPITGNIAGLEAMGLRCVLERLANPKLLLREGLVLPSGSSNADGESDPGDPDTTGGLTACPAIVAMATSNQIAAASGTYDW